ncbi:MAG TPA: TIGR03067 domain-containing protein [Pirellulales bacterium]|nr:TIGR03067 domain-containing protein [Pirellulales bacterium]
MVALLLVTCAAADDLEKLQGKWEGTTANKQHVTLAIKKNHIAMSGERDGILSSSECEFKLDETLNPKTLDFGKMRIFVGKERKEDLNVINLPMPAIYRLEGQHFDLCIGFGEERPKGFPEKLPTTGCIRFTRVADNPAGSKGLPTNQK